jgi:hypothetical protein
MVNLRITWYVLYGYLLCPMVSLIPECGKMFACAFDKKLEKVILKNLQTLITGNQKSKPTTYVVGSPNLRADNYLLWWYII